MIVRDGDGSILAQFRVRFPGVFGIGVPFPLDKIVEAFRATMTNGPSIKDRLDDINLVTVISELRLRIREVGAMSAGLEEG